MLLVATVVGSGVMATRLTDDVGLQLLANIPAPTGAVARRADRVAPTGVGGLQPAS